MMISVIMSVYNAEKFLKEAIDSILNQSYKDFEFIIVNDCSTDKSGDILKQYEKDFDRIVLINNTKNLGLTKNLNLALAVAKGEYIARMDADDISELTRFERQIDYLKNHNDVDIIGTYSNDINENGEIIRNRTTPVSHKDIISMLPKFSPISHPTVMFRKDSLKKLGYYNVKYRTSQDLEMWLRAAGAGLKFHNIPEYLFKYRMGDDYVGRKSFKFRWNDFRLRCEGYKHIHLPWYKYTYALIPLALGMVPESFYFLLKRMDPR